MQGIIKDFINLAHKTYWLMKAEEEWDIFICHSSFDKEDVAEPLANCMKEMGVKAFYDKNSIPKTADSDLDIVKALDNSQIGVVIYSENFLKSPYSISERSIIYKGKIKGLNDVFPIYYQISPKDSRIVELGFYRNYNGVVINDKKDIPAVAAEINKVVMNIKKAEIDFLKQNSNKNILNKSTLGEIDPKIKESEPVVSIKKILQWSLILILLSVGGFFVFKSSFYNSRDNDKILKNNTGVIFNGQQIDSLNGTTQDIYTPNNSISQTPFENNNKIHQPNAEQRNNSSAKSEKEDFSLNINSSILNTERTDIAVLIIDESGNFSAPFSKSIANIYNKSGNNTTIGLLKNSFIHTPEFNDLMMGNSDIIKMLGLAKHADYLAIGEIKLSFRPGALEAGTIVCSAGISINIISTQNESIVQSFSISDINGNGVSESQAKEIAIKKLLYTYSSQYSSL